MRTSVAPPVSTILQVNSNQSINDVAQSSKTPLAEVQHVRFTSTPGDDLVEEDFMDRLCSLLQPMTGLVSITLCIPTMARLHPSNSLPKVISVLHGLAALHPRCQLSLAVHEAEQAWGALVILNRVIDLKLKLHSIEFTRAFFPLDTLLQAAQSCNLASLTLDATQVFPSSTSPDTTTPTPNSSGTPTLTSLAIHAPPSDAIAGSNALLSLTTPTLTHLDLTSASQETSLTLPSNSLPLLTHLAIHEDLLLSLSKTNISAPLLHDLTVPTLTRPETCAALRDALAKSWPSVRTVRVSRVEAGPVSEALASLERAAELADVDVTIGELAVRGVAGLTPGALGLSERLVNAVGPIVGEWPLDVSGWRERGYPRLKAVALKVRDGSNCEEFIRKLDTPGLVEPVSVVMIGGRKGKAGKK